MGIGGDTVQDDDDEVGAGDASMDALVDDDSDDDDERELYGDDAVAFGVSMVWLGCGGELTRFSIANMILFFFFLLLYFFYSMAIYLRKIYFVFQINEIK